MVPASVRLWSRLLDPGSRALAVGSSALLLAERLLLAASVLSASRAGLVAAVPLTLLLALASALRGALRSPLIARVRRGLTAAAARALLTRDQLRPLPVARDRLEYVVFEGLTLSEQVAGHALPELVGDALAAAALTIWAAPLLPPSLLALLAAPLLAAGLLSEAGRRASYRAQQRSASAFDPVGESLHACVHGAADLVGNGRGAAHLARLSVLTGSWVRAGSRAEVIAALSGRAPVLAAAAALGLELAASRGGVGRLPPGAWTDVLLAATLLAPLSGVARSLIALGRSDARLAALLSLLGEASEAGGDRARPAPVLPAALAFQGVSHAYERPGGGRGEPVFAALTLVWEPGVILALAGPNGAGKSTVFRLLLGLGAPSSGEILVGGARISSLDARALRSQAAYLPQPPFLPERATVGEAMRLLAAGASDAVLTGALGRVGLLARLARGSPGAPLSVPVAALSAGERQRLSLARVVAQDARLVLLDEPDSNLDAEGVQMLVGLIRELGASRMVGFIAHSAEVLAAADRVVELGPTRHEVNASGEPGAGSASISA